MLQTCVLSIVLRVGASLASPCGGNASMLSMPFDGFTRSSAKCGGNGTHLSSTSVRTFEACREHCLSTDCNAFEFTQADNCVLYKQPGGAQRDLRPTASRFLQQTVLDRGCYVRDNTGRRLEGDTCSTVRPCAAPEICSEGSCERTDQEIGTALECATRTEPTVPPFSEAGIKNTALANSPGGKAIIITQESFATGELDIAQSGYYRFEEDVSIPFVYKPLDGISPRHLGQTVGIRIRANDVVIDLNGHTLEMSEECAKNELFMTLIQLNNNNFFEPVIGYTALETANRVLIFSSAKKPGTVKRSTHFGISGILNKYVIVKNINIEEMEIGGISITDAENVHIEDVVVDNANLKVPFTPFYGVVQQLRRRVHQIIAFVKANALPDQEPLATWESRLAIIDAQLAAGETNYLANPTPDRPMGNSFGIQIKPFFNVAKDGGKHVNIVRATVRNIRAGPKSVVTVGDDSEFQLALKDLDANVYEWGDFFEDDGTAKPCPLTDDKCVMNDLRLKAAQYLCELPVDKWPGGMLCQDGLKKLIDNKGMQNLRPVQQLDIRNHFPKGAFGVHIESVTDAILKDVKVLGVDNSDVGTKYVLPVENIGATPLVWRELTNEGEVFKNGHCAFGVFCRNCKFMKITDVTAQGIQSANGLAIGIGMNNGTSNVAMHRISAHVATPFQSVQEPSKAAFNMPFYVGTNTTDCVHMEELVSLRKSNGRFLGESAFKTEYVYVCAACLGALLLIVCLLSALRRKSNRGARHPIGQQTPSQTTPVASQPRNQGGGRGSTQGKDAPRTSVRKAPSREAPPERERGKPVGRLTKSDPDPWIYYQERGNRLTYTSKK